MKKETTLVLFAVLALAQLAVLKMILERSRIFRESTSSARHRSAPMPFAAIT
jgi:hypothetical protein